MRIFACLAAAVLLAACSTPGPDFPAGKRGGAAVSLAAGAAFAPSGVYQGTPEPGVVSFKGIGYARPPIGDLRWKPPVPLADSKARIDATKYGPACAQAALGGDTLRIAAPKRQSEDCLNLNIWTPARTADARLPVMVWIHGGWFARGSARQYPGYELASKGKVVVVTLDYRLGPFGFLAHPLLEQESPQHSAGNYGLLDQIEALRWVRKNIAAFGGDPGRVTLFGQSAGGSSVCYLLASPLAKGLFQRAIMQSGTCARGRPARAAYKEREAVSLSAKVKCQAQADILACLRRKPAAQILSALPTSASYGARVYYSPNRDGYVLPGAARELLAADGANRIPVMIGSTTDDASRFVPPIFTGQAWAEYVQTHWPKQAQRLLALYPVASGGDVHRTVVRAFTDMRFGCAALQTADVLAGKGHSTYLYLFSYVPRFGARQNIGAYHAAELPYVFGNLRQTNGHEYGPDDRRLSDRLIAIWTRFAATGSPNGPGLPDWPAFAPGSDTVQELGLDEKTIKNPAAHACAALHRLGLQ